MSEADFRGRFLQVALRDGDEVADAEYDDFLRATGLAPEDLVHHPITAPADGLPDLGDYAGVFVGGSPFNITDLEHPPLQRHVHALLRRIAAHPTPALMLCYGSSWAAFAAGGRVDCAHGEPAGVSEVRLTAAAADDPVFGGLPESFTGLTGHKEGVAELPPSATLLATGPRCAVQAYRANATTWVTQFHPELDAEGILRRMAFYEDAGYFAPEEVAEIAARVRAADLGPSGRIVPAFVAHCLRRAGGRA